MGIQEDLRGIHGLLQDIEKLLQWTVDKALKEDDDRKEMQRAWKDTSARLERALGVAVALITPERNDGSAGSGQ